LYVEAKKDKKFAFVLTRSSFSMHDSKKVLYFLLLINFFRIFEVINFLDLITKQPTPPKEKIPLGSIISLAEANIKNDYCFQLKTTKIKLVLGGNNKREVAVWLIAIDSIEQKTFGTSMLPQEKVSCFFF
jgi:hypothetical protein